MKTPPLVLAISGKRFSGKDTFAAMLVEAAREMVPSLDLRTHAFAFESKRMFVAARAAAGESVDLDRLQNDRAYKELWRPKLTQLTVDSIARDPLVFCRSVADRIAASSTAALITDLRLKVEIEHLRSRFDLRVIRLLRSDEERAKSGWVKSAAADEHHTETELDDSSLWDEVVTNDGSLDELASKARAVVASAMRVPT